MCQVTDYLIYVHVLFWVLFELLGARRAAHVVDIVLVFQCSGTFRNDELFFIDRTFRDCAVFSHVGNEVGNDVGGYGNRGLGRLGRSTFILVTAPETE